MIPRTNFQNNYFFEKLSNKTQMIRNSGDCIFTNRKKHTGYVVKACKEISEKLGIEDIIDIKRLQASANFHDIGHTPFGHAGEDVINELFMTFDNMHYSEKHPGLFKHNVNSVRLLSKSYGFDEDDFIIMDSILKHGSVFPKNYNYLPYKDSNIIKMNYVFKKMGLENSKFMENFINSLCLSVCPARSEDKIINRKVSYSCRKKGICIFLKKEDIGKGYDISSYLAYPYPLTLEGTVLYWADEISCFCSDLYDLFVYMWDYEEDSQRFIPFSNMSAVVHRLKALYSQNNLISHLMNYLDFATSKNSHKDYNQTLHGIVHSIYIELINQLIVNLDNTDNGVHIVIKGNSCVPLIDFDDNMKKIYKIIKDSIYSDVHNIKYIHDTNEAGKEMIRSLVNFYSKHFKWFIKDYKQFGKSTRGLNLDEELINSSYNLLHGNVVENVPYKYKKNFLKLVKNNKIRVNARSISKIDLFKCEDKKDDEKGEIRLLNFFRREICYFVASLDEIDIINLCVITHKLKLNYKLPTLSK